MEDKQLVQKMSDTIVHRGPDDAGYYTDKYISLGHRRLSIIDLNTGRQPIHNEDGTIWIVFNGEIYNFKELRAALEKKHEFYTSTDTEVIVHCYEEYGDKFLEMLNGMFAFALWDSNRNRLILARDPMGKKPLYYCHDGGRLFFASEVKALLAAGLQKTIDEEGLRSYLAYGYTLGHQTLFKGIKKMMAGHILTIEKGKIEIKKYWDIVENLDYKSDETYFVRRLRELLEQSARNRMIADVPIGAFLSGGLDSSAVVALSRPHADYDFHTFSIGFETFSELPYAKAVSEHMDTVHHEILVDGEMAYRSIDKVAWHYDEPLGDAAIVNNYLLAREASKNVKVVLAGEAGDEIFGGYSNYRINLGYTNFNRIPLLDQSIRLLYNLIPQKGELLLSKSKYPRYALKSLDIISQTSLEKMELISTRMLNDLEVSYLSHVNTNGIDAAATINRGVEDPLNRLLITDCKNLLPEKYLMKADKAIMASSVEERLPLMDKNIVEFAFTMPGHLKLNNGNEKYVLKMAVRDLLPELIVKRKKQGFNTQVGSWMLRQAFKDRIIQVLEDNSLVKSTFKEDKISKLLNRFKNNDISRDRVLWHIFALGLWHEVYFNDVS